MKVVVESWTKKNQRLVPQIKKTALKVGRLLSVKNGYLEILLVGDKFMKKNVLAFPAAKGFPRPDIKKRARSLGEIYLNPDYIKKQEARDPSVAKGYGGHGKRQDLTFMLVHGFLHLLGYDHVNKNDRIRMERKEVELLSKL